MDLLDLDSPTTYFFLFPSTPLTFLGGSGFGLNDGPGRVLRVDTSPEEDFEVDGRLERTLEVDDFTD